MEATAREAGLDAGMIVLTRRGGSATAITISSSSLPWVRRLVADFCSAACAAVDAEPAARDLSLSMEGFATVMSGESAVSSPSVNVELDEPYDNLVRSLPLKDNLRDAPKESVGFAVPLVSSVVLACPPKVPSRFDSRM